VSIELYEVNPGYIDYLSSFAPHLFHNKKQHQKNTRKFIGVILSVNNMKYFAPLSSYKPKHEKMKNSVDFIKLKNYAVVNINNMFPVPDGQFKYVNFAEVADPQYKKLLISEYRILRKLQDKITKSASEVYKHKIKYGTSTALAKRCNDFQLLEQKCKEFTR
jgi:protein AbiQ